MKKIIIVLLFLAGSLGFTNVNAQQKPSVKKSVATTKTTTVKAKDSTMAKKALLKKDGTPDMRMKENKVAKTTAVGPKKKDGTSDMRYKTNKAKTK